MSKKHLPPLIQVYEHPTRRKMIHWIIENADSDEWVRKADIVADIGCAGESVRRNLSMFIKHGLLDVKDAEVQISHYRPADTEVVDMLTTWDHYPLLELFDTTASQQLVDFFLNKSDPTQSYSRTALQEQSDAGYTGIKNNIGTLVEAGVVNEVEGTRSTEYQLNRDSEIVTKLETLDDVIYRCFRNRT